MSDLILLARLLAGPQHGYALKKHVGFFSSQSQMHNNLVYPLLRRFVHNGWIRKRSAVGQRGQTREVYALTKKGKQELLRRLGEFSAKDAASENAFRLRVGLFAVLDAATRQRILGERDGWLAARLERLAKLQASMDLGEWGGEVVRFLRRQTDSEREWIARLHRSARRESR